METEKKGKRRPRSLTAVTALLSAMVLTVWAVSMGLLTAAAAEFGAYQVKAVSESQASYMTELLKFSLERRESRPNGRELAFWETFASTNALAVPSYLQLHEGRLLPMWEHEQLYTAAAIYDGEGNLLGCSWQDSMYFQYMTAEDWEAGGEYTTDMAIALLDRTCLTRQGQENLGEYSIFQWPRALRLTGVFEGTTFRPARIEGVLYEDVEAALRERGGGSYILSQVIEDYDLPWQLLYEDPEVSEDVTLNADYFRTNWGEDSPALSYQGEEYPNLAALMEELGPTLAGASEDLNQHQWRDLVRISADYRVIYEGQTYWDSNYAGENGYQGEAPEVEYCLVSMVYASPLRNALWSLWKLYACTFCLAVALVLAGRGVLRRQLIRPAQSVGRALLKEDTMPDRRYSEKWYWQEGADLLQGFLDNRDRCQARKNEVNRLTAALDYAKTAEEDRRQLTSHIAHELKTPLAVVHSYAEGLKEHIAEDKRDRYLEVILSETERMDAMVLEMLDFSRLEAGKVKLSRDDFSLADVVRSVFDRLERSIQAKELTVTLDFPEDSTVTADEGRMAQVIENLAVNAVRYTPEGGNIWVRIERKRGKTTLRMENTAQPLPNQTLSQIWERFYRGDPARTGEGTGLGLAIVKSIIDLHGGTCAARNTREGLEFSVTI